MSDIYDRAIDLATRIHNIGDKHIGIYLLVNEAVISGIEHQTALAKENDIIAYEELIMRWEQLSSVEKNRYDVLRALERG